MIRWLGKAIADRIMDDIRSEQRRDACFRESWREFYEKLYSKTLENLNTRAQRAESLVTRLRRENHELREKAKGTWREKRDARR